MESPQRTELFERLKYTLLTSRYEEVDEILKTLIMKENIGFLYQDFFEGCSVDSQGYLIKGGFFAAPFESCPMDYALYNLLGWAPDSFLLKHQVRKVRIDRGVGCSDSFQLPRGLFLLPNLEELRVSHMGLKFLPDLEKNNSSLKILRLDHNGLTHIPRDFLRFSQLRVLDLSYNNLNGFPKSGHMLKSLESLSLQANRLSLLPVDLKNYRKLKSLDVSMNLIEKLDQNMEDLVQLNHISLAFNRLKVSEEAHWEGYFSHSKKQMGFSF